MHEVRLRDYFQAHLPEMLAELKLWVDHESPSQDEVSLDALRDRLQADLTRICSPPQENLDGLSVFARFDPAKIGQKPGLIVGHFDTVWPLGTLSRMPFRIAGGQGFGPGIYDMKAGLLLIFWALRACRDLGLQPSRPIHVLITRDEETGSKRSRKLIERLAKMSAYALIVEPPLADGGLKTGRKGVGGYEVTIEGRAAHAGVEPEKGVNAIIELTYQILQIQRVARPEAGTTINVGTIQGGTTPNVVADRASARLDVRAATQAEAERVNTELHRLAPIHPAAKVAVTGGINRPPMERTTAGVALFEAAYRIAKSLGFELREGSTGGGSDGNFTAAVGTPTLDGLGVPGGGAHAENEHIEISRIAERAAMLASLILTL